jgi:hypothetical protein
VELEGLGQLKKPMTSLGIEPTVVFSGSSDLMNCWIFHNKPQDYVSKTNKDINSQN